MTTLTKAQREEVLQQVMNAKSLREFGWGIFIILLVLGVLGFFNLINDLAILILIALITNKWIVLLSLAFAIFAELRYQNQKNKAKLMLAGKPEYKEI